MRILILEAFFVLAFFTTLPMRAIAIQRYESMHEILSMSTKQFLNLFLPTRSYKKLAALFFHCIFSGVVFSYLAEKVLYSSINDLILRIGIIIFLFIVVECMMYLSIFDIEFFEVPNRFSLFFLGFLILTDISLLYFTKFNGSIYLWENHYFYPFSNLIAGGIAGFLIFLLVFFTKERGMGSGDIRIAAMMGLLLGLQKIVIGFYATIISACILSLMYSWYLKRFKGVKIPFVPFIVFGTLITLILSHEIVTIFLRFYLK